jgi:hypothetical protein
MHGGGGHVRTSGAPTGAGTLEVEAPLLQGGDGDLEVPAQILDSGFNSIGRGTKRDGTSEKESAPTLQCLLVKDPGEILLCERHNSVAWWSSALERFGQHAGVGQRSGERGRRKGGRLSC